jgi:hypothetical protein
MRNSKQGPQYVVCLANDGYPASLIVRKIYQSLPDKNAEKRGLRRVIDESGEDYLYPKSMFASVDLPSALTKKFATAR